MPGRIGLRAALLAGPVIALALAAPVSAAAGGEVAASVPADRAVLDTAPERVELTFTAVPLTERSHLSVVDGANRRISPADPPTVRGTTLSQTVTVDRPGDYTVVYHVEFADGTDAQGWRRFSVGTGVAPAPLTEAQRRDTAATAQDHGHGVDPVSAVLLLANAVVVLVVVARLLATRPAVRPTIPSNERTIP